MEVLPWQGQLLVFVLGSRKICQISYSELVAYHDSFPYGFKRAFRLAKRMRATIRA